MIIEINIEKELDYETDFFAHCNCGCNKKLYKGMTTFRFGYKYIYNKCLEKFLKTRKVVL